MTAANPSAARLAAMLRGRRTVVGAGLPAGFPNLTGGASVLEMAVRTGGADYIELGLPHVDPVCDGPDMAQAHVRARHSEASIPEVLAVVDLVSSLTPIMVPAYFSSVVRYGVRQFAEDLAHAGAAGARIVDLPEDEAAEWHATAAYVGLLTPRLVTRGASDVRLARLAQASAGWLHVPAGPSPPYDDGALELGELRGFCERLRKCGAAYITCGGDVADPGLACTIAPWTDGLVIDSPLVRSLLSYPGRDGVLDAVEHVRAVHLALAHMDGSTASVRSQARCDSDRPDAGQGGAA